MHPFLVNKLAIIAVAISLAVVSGTVHSEKQEPLAAKQIGQSPLKKPLSYKGLIQSNQQVYYSGDPLEITLIIPPEVKALLKGDAKAHLSIYFPNGEVKVFPVEKEGQFLDTTVDTSVLAVGNYRLALVLTQGSSHAAKDKNGFTELLSVSRVKMSDKQKGHDKEDSDGDGRFDGDTNGNGFSDSEGVDAARALSGVGATDKRTLKRSTKADKTVEGQLVESVSVSADEPALKSAIREAIDLLFVLGIPAEEYYAAEGQPGSPDILTPTLSGQYVANIVLNSEAFSYQAILKTESEGVPSAIAGKTVQITYNQGTSVWTCGPGNPNGIDIEYLPIECRQ